MCFTHYIQLCVCVCSVRLGISMLYTHTYTHTYIYIHTFKIILSSWWTDFLLYYYVVTFFMPFNFNLKSALSDVSIAVPVWFDFGFCLLRILFLYPCSYLSLCIYLLVRWVSCRQQTVAPPQPPLPRAWKIKFRVFCMLGRHSTYWATFPHWFCDSACFS